MYLDPSSFERIMLYMKTNSENFIVVNGITPLEKIIANELRMLEMVEVLLSVQSKRTGKTEAEVRGFLEFKATQFIRAEIEKRKDTFVAVLNTPFDAELLERLSLAIFLEDPFADDMIYARLDYRIIRSKLMMIFMSEEVNEVYAAINNQDPDVARQEVYDLMKERLEQHRHLLPPKGTTNFN